MQNSLNASRSIRNALQSLANGTRILETYSHTRSSTASWPCPLSSDVLEMCHQVRQPFRRRRRWA